VRFGCSPIIHRWCHNVLERGSQSSQSTHTSRNILYNVSFSLPKPRRPVFTKMYSHTCLPYFLKHTHIAFRFVSQVSYNRAARLDIVPMLDVVTRIFMLSKVARRLMFQSDQTHLPGLRKMWGFGRERWVWMERELRMRDCLACWSGSWDVVHGCSSFCPGWSNESVTKD
jgi:hypothetical protein